MLEFPTSGKAPQAQTRFLSLKIKLHASTGKLPERLILERKCVNENNTCALSAPNFSQLLRGFTSLTLNNINTGSFKVPASNNTPRSYRFKTKQNPCSFRTAGHSGCVAGRHVSSPGSQRIPFSFGLCSLLNVSHRSTRDFFKKYLIPHFFLKKTMSQIIFLWVIPKLHKYYFKIKFLQLFSKNIVVLTQVKKVMSEICFP